jgi:LuxR family transcriptional regulator, maltose regulon positive regulatory protein
VTTVRTKRALQRSRIIERPRLLAVLDGSEARVRALVAAAGYGKTTLAEQWVNRAERRHAWYTARSASADVAALALGLARSASTIVHDSEVRLREHLRAVSAAAERTSVLAEILSEDLAAWPGDAWLVIDDYQEFAGAAEAEGFVAELVASCPVQILITSRQRPSWMTARSILYGEVLEINQAALAMNNQEAAEVLTDWSLPSASGLVALANGWPAVIGLASVSAAEIDGDVAVPESLYSFFAEEVFAALGDEIREGLSLLAVAPVIDRELAHALLGERADSICEAAIEVGILVEREDRLDLHPLARAFLEERVPTPPRDAIDTCLVHYRRRRDWDAAFDLIVRCDISDELQGLLTAALDDLLKAARLSTIEAWCDHADEMGPNRMVSLARAEIALRRGRHALAQTHAELAAVDPELSSRALLLAGRAAHLASQEEEALQLYRRAEELAANENERGEALYGQLVCLIELESPAAVGAMKLMLANASRSDAQELVRNTAASLHYQQRFGAIDLREADVAAELLPNISDPLIESSFLSVYSTNLALSARYEDAARFAGALHDVATRFRLDFAVPYAKCWSAMAYAGLRRWGEADDCLRAALGAAYADRDEHAIACFRATQLRTLAQQGRLKEALDVSLPPHEHLLPATRAELVGSRALVLAAVGRVREASLILDSVRGTSRAVEATVLTAAVDALISLKLGRDEAPMLAIAARDKAFATGALDFLICTYRAAPEMLVVLLRKGPQDGRTRELIETAGDQDLVDAVGHSLASESDPLSLLSQREQEVYELLCQGLTDKQIAEILVIAVSTVKAHAHHIYDKLGLRSRRELAVRAALQRQATSATGDSSSSS